MSVPSKARSIKLDNPAQRKVSHHLGTKLHRLKYRGQLPP